MGDSGIRSTIENNTSSGQARDSLTLSLGIVGDSGIRSITENNTNPYPRGYSGQAQDRLRTGSGQAQDRLRTGSGQFDLIPGDSGG